MVFARLPTQDIIYETARPAYPLHLRFPGTSTTHVTAPGPAAAAANLDDGGAYAVRYLAGVAPGPSLPPSGTPVVHASELAPSASYTAESPALEVEVVVIAAAPREPSVRAAVEKTHARGLERGADASGLDGRVALPEEASSSVGCGARGAMVQAGHAVDSAGAAMPVWWEPPRNGRPCAVTLRNPETGECLFGAS